MNAATKNAYPYLEVEGRVFAGKHDSYAFYFARDMAARMGRRVHVMHKLDAWTPAAVIYTAEPEED